MFKKNILLLCMFGIFLFGCATIDSHTVGGYQNNMETGLSVYHQYYETLIKTVKGKSVESNIVFITDANKDLPINVKKLQICIVVENPFKRNFEVWESIELIDLETNKPYLKHKKLRHNSQLLPEELISIDMPLYSETHSQVVFSVDLIDESGNILYSTYTAKYKIGSKNK